ncbi:MAG: hypothetical protein IKK24_03235 [Clostridia bacterium]|nr:hypothetical protein [Clostridia bacterium]
MKKIICIVLLSIIILSGCNQNTQEDTVSDFVVIYPTDDSVNGYRDPDLLKGKDDAETVYYANLKTKKFHLSTCTYAQNTAEENTFISRDRDELNHYGFAPCKVCNP